MKVSKTEYAVYYKLESKYKNLPNLKRSWFKIKKMSDFKWNLKSEDEKRKEQKYQIRAQVGL
jgi:hypothetical protein